MSDAWWCEVCGHWENWHEDGVCLMCGRARHPSVRNGPHAFVRGERRTVTGPVGRDLEPAAIGSTEIGGGRADGQTSTDTSTAG